RGVYGRPAVERPGDDRNILRHVRELDPDLSTERVTPWARALVRVCGSHTCQARWAKPVMQRAHELRRAASFQATGQGMLERDVAGIELGQRAQVAGQAHVFAAPG